MAQSTIEHQAEIAAVVGTLSAAGYDILTVSKDGTEEFYSAKAPAARREFGLIEVFKFAFSIDVDHYEHIIDHESKKITITDQDF